VVQKNMLIKLGDEDKHKIIIQKWIPKISLSNLIYYILNVLLIYNFTSWSYAVII